MSFMCMTKSVESVTHDCWNKDTAAEQCIPTAKNWISISFDMNFFTQSPSLTPSIPPFLARSACKSTLRFGSHTLELTAAESRPKAIWGQGSGRDRGRDRARQGGRDRRMRRNDRKQLTGDTKKEMILYHLHL